MTITQIRKKYGGYELMTLSTGELVFKVDNNHVRLVKITEAIHPGDYLVDEIGVLETPIVCVSNDTTRVGQDYNSNVVITDECKTWISAKYVQDFLNTETTIENKR